MPFVDMSYLICDRGVANAENPEEAHREIAKKGGQSSDIAPLPDSEFDPKKMGDADPADE